MAAGPANGTCFGPSTSEKYCFNWDTPKIVSYPNLGYVVDTPNAIWYDNGYTNSDGTHINNYGYVQVGLDANYGLAKYQIHREWGYTVDDGYYAEYWSVCDFQINADNSVTIL